MGFGASALSGGRAARCGAARGAAAVWHGGPVGNHAPLPAGLLGEG